MVEHKIECFQAQLTDLKGLGKKDLPKNCAVIRPGCKALRVGNIEYIHRSEQRSSRVEGQARLG
jgi:hypothetical protein